VTWILSIQGAAHIESETNQLRAKEPSIFRAEDSVFGINLPLVWILSASGRSALAHVNVWSLIHSRHCWLTAIFSLKGVTLTPPTRALELDCNFFHHI